MASSSEQSPSAGTQDDYPDLHHVRKLQRTKSSHDSTEVCRVCGDGHARMHYGVLTCFGCKGFFRRTLKRPTEYTCRHQGNCIVDRHERNSCRFCRFKRCLEVGMDPKAVRPDRDATGRHYQARARRSKLLSEEGSSEETSVSDDWCRKLPVDMRTTLMQLMNIELMVNNGDSQKNAKEMYPLPFESLRQILDDPSLLDGKRTEMRYEPYRKVAPDELVAVAHRRLIAIIDWVDHLFDIMDIHGVEDKLTLVKSGFAPLTIFSFATSTAKSTKDRDILCLCNFGYVPRDVHRVFEEPYHLANRIIDRALDDLVEPFRALRFKDEEIVLLKAVIILNPYLRSLSLEAAEQIADFRDRILETLYHVVRETHPKEVASSRFGNLLLFIPSIMILGNVMYENLQFVQSFGKQSIDPLLCELLDNIEPVDDNGALMRTSRTFAEENGNSTIRSSASSSSISSLASHTSESSYESITPSEEATQDSEADTRRLSLTSSCLQSSQILEEHIGISNACSLPNLDQMPQSVSDSDPDYNLTLTPDMFTGMRQAISATQSMETDGRNTPPNSPEFGYKSLATPRPHFFIDDGARTTTIEAQGTRHKFFVTTRSSSEDKDTCTGLPSDFQNAMPFGGKPQYGITHNGCDQLNGTVTDSIPIANGGTQSCSPTLPNFGSFPGAQMPVTKTLSCPRSNAPFSYVQAPVTQRKVTPATVNCTQVPVTTELNALQHLAGTAIAFDQRIASCIENNDQSMDFDDTDFY